jgi:hypothetical protein
MARAVDPFLAVLLTPVVGVWELASGDEASGLWVVAPLVGAFLVAHDFSFDVCGSPPYPRNSEAGDMPAWAILAGASVACATRILTQFRRGLEWL